MEAKSDVYMPVAILVLGFILMAWFVLGFFCFCSYIYVFVFLFVHCIHWFACFVWCLLCS